MNESEEFRATELAGKEFTPMPMAGESAAKEETFKSDYEGVRAASEELSKRRQEGGEPVIPRVYETFTKDGERTGERRELHETRKLGEAANDLARVRQAEGDADAALANMSLRERIDHFRQAAEIADQNGMTVEQLEQHAANRPSSLRRSPKRE